MAPIPTHNKIRNSWLIGIWSRITGVFVWNATMRGEQRAVKEHLLFRSLCSLKKTAIRHFVSPWTVSYPTANSQFCHRFSFPNTTQRSIFRTLKSNTKDRKQHQFPKWWPLDFQYWWVEKNWILDSYSSCRQGERSDSLFRRHLENKADKLHLQS